MKTLKQIVHFFLFTMPTFYYCLRSGIPYDSTYHLDGRIRIIKHFPFMGRGGTLTIGRHFTAHNSIESNPVGLFLPCIFNISKPDCRIIIGDNVGISGSTIFAVTSITIGNNVLIGPQCIISDTDGHPIDADERNNNTPGATASAPIVICDNAFIGTRCLIMKGVTIGEGAVISAGAVVIKDIPPYTIYGGNPARFYAKIEPKGNRQDVLLNKVLEMS